MQEIETERVARNTAVDGMEGLSGWIRTISRIDCWRRRVCLLPFVSIAKEPGRPEDATVREDRDIPRASIIRLLGRESNDAADDEGQNAGQSIENMGDLWLKKMMKSGDRDGRSQNLHLQRVGRLRAGERRDGRADQ